MSTAMGPLHPAAAGPGAPADRTGAGCGVGAC
jgi:hypothetical protein